MHRSHSSNRLLVLRWREESPVPRHATRSRRPPRHWVGSHVNGAYACHGSVVGGLTTFAAPGGRTASPRKMRRLCEFTCWCMLIKAAHVCVKGEKKNEGWYVRNSPIIISSYLLQYISITRALSNPFPYTSMIWICLCTSMTLVFDFFISLNFHETAFPPPAFPHKISIASVSSFLFPYTLMTLLFLPLSLFFVTFQQH